MIAWQATVQDGFGNAVPLPVITVYANDGVTIASIFTEEGVALPNPLTGTMEGFVQFWANDGDYEIVGADGGDQTERWYVTLGAGSEVNQEINRKPNDFSTRDQLIDWVAAGNVVAQGRIVFAGGLAYKGRTGSTAIPDMPGVVPAVGGGFFKHFGAIGDGSADDSAPISAWVAYNKALWLTGAVAMRAGTEGVYRFDKNILGFFIPQSGNPQNLSTVSFEGVRLVCFGSRTSPYDYAVAFGDPSQTGIFSMALNSIGCRLETTSTYPPIGVYFGSVAQVFHKSWQIQGQAARAMNQILIHGVQNFFLDDMIAYGGGHSIGYSDTSGSLFRQAGTSLERVSGAYVWPADCVGQVVEITNPTGSSFRKSFILARLSDTVVTVGDADCINGVWTTTPTSFNDTVDRLVFFGSPAVATTAGSNVVSLTGSGPMDDRILNLHWQIPQAGVNRRALFGYATAYDPIARTITLSQAAGTTLDPIANPFSDMSCIGSSAITVLSDIGNGFTNGISQLMFNNIQVETHRGFGFAIDDAEGLEIHNTKIHGSSLANSNYQTYSLGNMIGNRIGGTIDMFVDQRQMSSHRFWIGDSTQCLTMPTLRVRARVGEKMFFIAPSPSGFPGKTLVLGDIHLTNGTPAWDLRKFISDTGAVDGWVCSGTLTFNTNDGFFAYLGNFVRAITDGTLFARMFRPEGQVSGNGVGMRLDTQGTSWYELRASAFGAFVTNLRWRQAGVNHQNAWWVWSSGDSETDYIAVNPSGRRIRFGQGGLNFLRNDGTTALTINDDLSLMASFPGPFADDAAAAAGGVALNKVYRVTGGTIAWRQA